MMGGVDGPSFDAVCRLTGFQVDDVNQRVRAVPVPFHTLEMIMLGKASRKKVAVHLDFV